jgi:RNA polymerase sigma-70 factor (ECF subfamily)
MAEKPKGDPWPSTRPTLMEGLARGDQGSWNEFVSVYAPLLYRYCRRRGIQDADAEAIAQDVVSKVLHFRYDRDRGRFRAWLSVVVRHEIAHLRRARIAEAAPAPEPTDVPEPEWLGTYYECILQKSLDRIRPEFSGDDEREMAWRAFERTWLDEPAARAAEVAAELERSVEWVYKAKHRVLRRLEQEVKTLAEDLVLAFEPGHPPR